MQDTEQLAAEAEAAAIDPEDLKAEAEAPSQDGAEAAPESEAEAEARKQREALKAAQSKQEEYLAMAQRVQADFDNYRRRNQNLRKEAFDDGARAFATTLLPVIDNLDRAIEAASGSADTSLLSGVQMVEKMLCEAFAKRGITPIDRLGQPFDPNLENAVIQGAPEDGEPGTVCAVLQKGYIMEGTVLRHAMVKVVPD